MRARIPAGLLSRRQVGRPHNNGADDGGDVDDLRSRSLPRGRTPPHGLLYNSLALLRVREDLRIQCEIVQAGWCACAVEVVVNTPVVRIGERALENAHVQAQFGHVINCIGPCGD